MVNKSPPSHAEEGGLDRFVAARVADWRIAEWPDGTWCDLGELEEFLKFKSDDYVVCRVLEWDESYTPTVTEAV